MFKILLLVAAFVVCFSCPDPERVERVINISKQNAWEMIHDNVWCFPTYLGTLFVSEYYIELLALNLTEKSQFNVTYHTELLINTQLLDGSWHQVHDAYKQNGSLDATIFNYWFLKTVGQNVQQDFMRRAHQFILQNGGIEKAQTMTKYKLAIFGKYPWKQLYHIPLYFFRPDGYFYLKDITAQWINPHIMPLAYLRDQKVIYNYGADISELFNNILNQQDVQNEQESQNQKEPDYNLQNLINEMLKIKRPKGSFGAYTVATMLTLLSFQDFTSKWPKIYEDQILSSMKTGFQFCEYNYLNNYTAYMGSADDGRWWDTILVTWGLLEAGENKENLVPIVDKMIADGVQVGKGIAYGWDFEYAPDVDDTGLLLAVLSHFGDKYKSTIEQIQNWTISMQNDDGGFAAFDREKQGNFFYQMVFKIAGITDSSEIFDPSCADLTAHVIEGFALNGIDLNDENVQRAIKYIKQNQLKQGSWEGRWGINHIYAVGAVIPALGRIGYNLKEQWIENAIKWLISKQNLDGGFGESTESYLDPTLHGVGVSTVTQTSWALLALIEVQKIYDVDESIEKAVEFLLTFFENNDFKFKDISVTGTGHRGLIYLFYPSYPYSFPLLSLSRFYKNAYNH